jgi:23S rRNA (cytosine1962-C5)-methyltransferase
MPTLTPDWTEYALLDSGAGRKLERFGEFTLIRPEPLATWTIALSAERWKDAQGEFVRSKSGRGKWQFRVPIPERWMMQRKNLRFWVQPAPSGHVGVFPDHACHWDWIADTISAAPNPPRVLCLFGHTGLASLSAAAAGAAVTHVDASRPAVAWARENQRLSGLSRCPIRWIVDDALGFVRREARRGNRYDGMILDPPRFGRGPKGELWKLEGALRDLLSICATLLSPEPLFVLLNLYTTTLTRPRVHQDTERLCLWVKQMLSAFRPTVTSGKLALCDAAGRRISTSVFARAQFQSL